MTDKEDKNFIQERNEPIRDIWISRSGIKVNKEIRNKDIVIPGPKENLQNIVINMINNSKDFICLSSFLLQKSNLTQALITKSKNLPIYILTASEAHLKKEVSDISEHDKEIVEAHKDLLDSLSDKILVRTADHFHAKFILIDPKSDNTVGFLFTGNFTVDAMNRNLEVGIRLDRNQVQSLYKMFTYGFWNEAKQELSEKILRSARKGPNSELTTPGDNGYVTVGMERTLKSQIKRIINNSNKRILLTTWTLDPNNEIFEIIMNKARSGVDIEVILKVNAINTKAGKELINAGVKVYGHDFMHAKTIITDDNDGLVMTSNISHLGLDTGFDAGIALKPDQVNTLKDLFMEWKKAAEWEMVKELPQNIDGQIYAVEDNKMRKMKVVNKKEINLGLLKTDPTSFNWPQEKDEIYQIIEYKWSILKNVSTRLNEKKP